MNTAAALAPSIHSDQVWIKSFLAAQADDGLSPLTITAYAKNLRQFQSYIAKRRRSLLSVDRNDVRGFAAKRLAHGVSAPTVATAISALRSFYSFLREDEVITRNPTLGIRLPKTWKQIPRSLASEEIELLAEGLTTTPVAIRDRAMILTLFASGLRVTELLSLQLTELDLERSTVFVHHGKGTKDRLAPLSGEAIAALREYLENARPVLCRGKETSYVFVGRRGQAPMTRQGIYWPIRKQAKKVLQKSGISPHTLRHSLATAMVRGGADLRFTQAVMGHASIDTTQIYLDTDIESLRIAYYDAHPRARIACTPQSSSI